MIKTNKSKELVAGIISLHKLYDSFSDDYLYSCSSIDLAYEEAVKELEAQGKTEEEIEEELQDYNNDYVNILFGDWKQNAEGLYEIDYLGSAGFAGSYSNNGGGTITLDWSKWSTECHHTSPCYVMSDGRPCGDLETKGNSVEAYCFPKDHYADYESINSVEFIEED